ncbi:MAG TPA: site-specific DNA-methyltransferase [Gemmataceae bacterium]|nr:site-specific DNA-methyltransferase [Gemmataceae bacterium]
MKRITAADPPGHSADMADDDIGRLQALFPEAFVEGKIDFEVLKHLLGGTVEEREERYGLNWHGKRRARQLALTPSMGTLRPCREESVDWDTTRNLVIEGDNLEVLKLLQKSFAGKVKLVYIDPPYNTGKDFVYSDDFRDSIGNYLRLTGQIDGEGRRITTNSDASGRFHTDWLNMMYPRLKLARALLTQEGAVLVSCDEAEHPRLRLMMDEIFGEENFIADIVWAAGRKNDSQLISVSHEYIVCYVKDLTCLKSNRVEWRQRKKGLDDIYAQADRLRRIHKNDYAGMTESLKAWFRDLPDSHPAKNHRHYSHMDARGVYFPDNISWPGGGGPRYEVLHPVTRKPVAVPSRGWMTSDPEKMRQWIAEDRVHFGTDEAAVPCIKSYLRDREYQAPYSVFYQDGRAATKRLRELMGDDCFDFPKDELVLQELVAMLTTGSDVVIDFFAGSGTTGHAVLAQNAADGGARRYVLVQLPAPLDPDNDGQKAAAAYCQRIGAPLNIAELTKERLRRVGDKIRSTGKLFSGDVGFRVYKLDSSNIRAWDPDRNDLAGSLLKSVQHLKSDRNEADVLTELNLKLGLDLCVPVEGKTIAGCMVHSVGGGVLLACLAPTIAASLVEPLAQGILAWIEQLHPADDSQVVFRDEAFPNDVAKTNMTAILSRNGVHQVRCL